jgi:hypothetical protein
MNVIAANVEVRNVADAVVREAALPDGKLGSEPMGVASLDESDCALQGCLWCEEKMDVVGHNDESVKLVVALGSIVLESFDEEFGVALDLKEMAAIVGSAGDEESSGA